MFCENVCQKEKFVWVHQSGASLNPMVNALLHLTEFSFVSRWGLFLDGIQISQCTSSMQNEK